MEQVADFLSTAAPTTWRGTSDLPRFPWQCPCRGLVLIVDMWSGIGGLIFAAVALGMRCVVLSAELDPDLQKAKMRLFPNLTEVQFVESIQVEMVSKLVQRRSVAAVLMGGGPPCQGNSALNSNRKGLQDSRSQQPAHLQRLAEDFRRAFPNLPLFVFLENVASAPREVSEAYSALLGTKPVTVDAAQWGYARRRRMFWLVGPAGGLDGHREFRLPEGTYLEFDPQGAQLGKSDGKPWPPNLRFEGGYSMMHAPASIASGQSEPIGTFSREFPHPTDRCNRASFQARLRFETDNRRFPPSSYEEASLLWKDGTWRQLAPAERAAIMGIPATALDEVAPHLQRPDRVAKLNSILGNGFHLPSLMLVLLVLFQLTDQAMAAQVPWPWSSSAEVRLRARVAGSIFDQIVLEESDHVMTGSQICDELFHILKDIPFEAGVVERCRMQLARVKVENLQCYWLFLVAKGHVGTEAPPCWKAQRQRGLAQAALGQQRAGGGAAHGVDHLLRPGLGRDGHARQAQGLPSPFGTDVPLDADLEFALEAITTFGPQVVHWRARNMKTLEQVIEILDPVEEALRKFRVSTSAAVAAGRRLVLMAFFTALLRWPDRRQALDYVHGFQVVGDIPVSGVFRSVVSADVSKIDDQFFGDAAVAALEELLKAKAPQDHETILRLTEEEMLKNYCGQLHSATHMNKLFGVGRWRPIHRFLISQSDGKQRLIDDGRRGDQNRWASLGETIMCIGIDFIPQVASALQQRVQCHADPDFKDMRFEHVQFSVADLPDAFRGLPVRPEDQPATVIAVYHGGQRQWRFTVMNGCPFGLGAVVVHFNRYPALLTACARRVFALLHGAYFDDNVLVESHVTAQSAHEDLMKLLQALGTPPKPAKTHCMSSHGVFLGASIAIVEDKGRPTVVVAPKEATRRQVIADLEHAIAAQHLSSAKAAKVRGRCGWLAANSVGRVGRIGQAVLKMLQYGERSSGRLTAGEVQALRFHLYVVQHVPPRTICTRPAQEQRPLVMYSDAEYTPGSPPQLGFVLFRDPPMRPVGVCLVLTAASTQEWLERRQQIYPAETIAVVLAMAIFAPALQGRDLIAFCDNSAAVATLIRGTAQSADVLRMAEVATLQQLTHGIRLWVEWVDSQSNPADGLSRAGLRDGWTLAQDWVLHEIRTQVPNLIADPFVSFQLVEHWRADCGVRV